MVEGRHLSRLSPAAALLVLSACASACLGQSGTYRAVWADAFSVGFKSNQQINDLVSRAVTGNYNLILAEVLAFHDTGASGHGAYWNSSIVPRAGDISGNIDPLGTLVALAHANGLEVDAWIVPYRVSSVWPPAGNALLAAHPEWLMVPQAAMGDGPATVGGYYTLDPGSPDTQEYLVSIVRELVSNYEIDGLNLDYIRYVQTDAGYPADENYPYSTLARFQALTGYPGVPPPTGVTSWNDFRRRTIDEFVRRLRAEIPSIANPREPLRLSADLIAFGDAPSDFTNSDAYRLHQNWRMWMQSGWLDLGIPMNYKREYNSQQRQWYRNWVNAMVLWRYQRHMACGQANYLNTMADSVTQLQYALNAGLNGTSNFSYDATADQNRDGTPETDWTWYTYVSNNLFTSPTAIPSMPWRDAATASEGTLWGRVVDDSTGLPVDGAIVQVGALAPVETDGNGHYVVTLIPAAAGGTSYTVTADSLACDTASAEATVLRGQVVRLDIDLCAVDPPAGPGDMDQDGDIDLDDLGLFLFCMQGPGAAYPPGHLCLNGDADSNQSVDMADLASFQVAFGQ